MKKKNLLKTMTLMILFAMSISLSLTSCIEEDISGKTINEIQRNLKSKYTGGTFYYRGRISKEQVKELGYIPETNSSSSEDKLTYLRFYSTELDKEIIANTEYWNDCCSGVLGYSTFLYDKYDKTFKEKFQEKTETSWSGAKCLFYDTEYFSFRCDYSDSSDYEAVDKYINDIETTFILLPYTYESSLETVKSQLETDYSMYEKLFKYSYYYYNKENEIFYVILSEEDSDKIDELTASDIFSIIEKKTYKECYKICRDYSSYIDLSDSSSESNNSSEGEDTSSGE